MSKIKLFLILLLSFISHNSISQKKKANFEFGLNISLQEFSSNKLENGEGYYSSLSSKEDGYVNGMNFHMAEIKLLNLNLVPRMAIYYPLKISRNYIFGLYGSLGLGMTFTVQKEYEKDLYNDFHDVDTIPINKVSSEIGLGLFFKYDLTSIFITQNDLIVSLNFYKSNSIINYYHPRFSIGLINNKFICQLYTNFYQMKTYYLINDEKVNSTTFKDVFGLSIGVYL
jgi:hypothetical protein